jgi:glucose dehydrogenase
VKLKLKRLTQAFVILTCAGVMAWVAVAQKPTTEAVTTKALVNAAGNGSEWLSYGRDYAETHFSPLTQISTKNVKRVSLAWSIATDAPQGTIEATPLMHNGVLYFSLPCRTPCPAATPS